MKNEKQTPLTILEACILLARETVSLLEGFDQLPDSAFDLRNALALASGEQDPGDGGALLVWVETEMESVRRFTETGEQTEPVVERKAPCATPGPIMLLDASCALLRAAAQRQPTEEQWQTMLEAVRLLAEINDLDEMILTGKVPNGGFLRAQDLRSQLESVRAAFRGSRQVASVSPCETAVSEVEAPCP